MVPDVALHEWSPTNEAPMPGGEVVEHDGRVAGAAQSLAGMRANIACTARNKDGGVAISQRLNQVPLLPSSMQRVGSFLQLEAPQNKEWSWQAPPSAGW